MRFMMSYGIALIIVVVVAGWLATGTLVIGGSGPGQGERPIVSLIEEDGGPITETMEGAGLKAPEHHPEHDPHLTIAQRQAEASEGDASLVSVRTMTYDVQPMQLDVPLRGQTRAFSTVAVVPETSGIVAEVAVEKGDGVEPGDLLCTLDQGTRAAAVAQAEAALAQAQASLTQAEADAATNAELREKGLAPANTARSLEVAIRAAEAAVSAAQSGLDNATAELARTEVRAESSGIVQDPMANVGAMLGGGSATPCVTIVRLDPILFRGVVPESRIGLAKLGLPAAITTVSGAKAEGEVSYIASVADPETRSFPVEISIPNPDRTILAGLTAEATVNLGTVPAHLLPQSVLTLDDQGVLGVRAVADGKVVFLDIEILRDTREGVWVSGLPARVDVITVGQEFVSEGQAVLATNEADAPAEPATQSGDGPASEPAQAVEGA